MKLFKRLSPTPTPLPRGEKEDFPEYELIAGVDEAGRGPLAGPLVVAGVILKADAFHEMLNDSKKLSEKKRELLFDWVVENSVAYQIEVVSAEVIDRLNILGATMYGMDRVAEMLAVRPEMVLFDGNMVPLEYEIRKGGAGRNVDYECKAVVKGDGMYACIAAASVLAKVTRDRIMIEMDIRYPEYGFKKHKGYPTKRHLEMIKEYGVCDEHRRTFL